MLNFKKGIEIAQIDISTKSLYISEKNTDRRMKDDFEKEKNKKRNENKYVEIEKGNFIPQIDLNERDTILVAGPSGSGKSTTAALLMNEWRQEFPKNDIYIFSRTDVKNDKAFKNIKKITQITIDEDLIDDPIDIETEISENTLVLFDDITTIQDKKLKDVIENLLADILEVGRKLRIWVICTSHLLIPNEKKLARTLLNESKKIIVFPQSGSIQQIRYVLKTYFGFNNKQIDEFLKTDSRWLLFSKNYPQYVLSEYQAWLP